MTVTTKERHRRTRAPRCPGRTRRRPADLGPASSRAGSPLRSSSRRGPSPSLSFSRQKSSVSLGFRFEFPWDSPWISFDFLVRIETFQGLIATPQAGKLMGVLSPHEERLSRVIRAGRAPESAPLLLGYGFARMDHKRDHSTDLDSQKEKSLVSERRQSPIAKTEGAALWACRLTRAREGRFPWAFVVHDARPSSRRRLGRIHYRREAGLQIAWRSQGVGAGGIGKVVYYTRTSQGADVFAYNSVSLNGVVHVQVTVQ